MRKGTAPFKCLKVNRDNLSKGKTFLWLAHKCTVFSLTSFWAQSLIRTNKTKRHKPNMKAPSYLKSFPLPFPFMPFVCHLPHVWWHPQVSQPPQEPCTLLFWRGPTLPTFLQAAAAGREATAASPVQETAVPSRLPTKTHNYFNRTLRYRQKTPFWKAHLPGRNIVRIREISSMLSCSTQALSLTPSLFLTLQLLTTGSQIQGLRTLQLGHKEELQALNCTVFQSATKSKLSKNQNKVQK